MKMHNIWDMISLEGGAEKEIEDAPDWTIFIGRGGVCYPGIGLNIQYKKTDNRHYSDCVIVDHPIMFGLDVIWNGLIQMPFDLWRHFVKH